MLVQRTIFALCVLLCQLLLPTISNTSQLFDIGESNNNAPTTIPTVTMVDDRIELQIVNNFLTESECEQLINDAHINYQPSLLVGDDNPILHSGRTSTSAELKPHDNELIQSIEQRIAEFADVDISQLEALQLIHYDDTQFIKPHYDYFTVKKAKSVANQRHYTMLVYLNTVQSQYGGGTQFVRLNHTIQPVQGTAVLWRNVYNISTPDKLTLHQALPVYNTVKYVLSAWIKFQPDTYRTLYDKHKQVE